MTLDNLIGGLFVGAGILFAYSMALLFLAMAVKLWKDIW